MSHVLMAEDLALIDGQYADRPALRPVIDAVLAAAPGLGDVSVAARKTMVSLVSPRRTFAVVQARTLTRVDLGLRLDGQEPAGRLLAARDLGAANLRIALTAAGDLDAEALALLQRAYDESVGPPAPRKKPAPRPAAAGKATITVLIEGSGLPGRTWCLDGGDGPGYQNVHVALRATDRERPGLIATPGPCSWLATCAFPGDAPSVRWEVPVTVARMADGYDFYGPYVRGGKADRHIALVWGDVLDDGTFRLFRGGKFRLDRINPALIGSVIGSNGRLVTRVRLTDARGNPSCVAVPGPDQTWSAAPGS